MPIAVGSGISEIFDIAFILGSGVGVEECLLLQDATPLLLQDGIGCLLLQDESLTFLSGGVINLLDGDTLDLIT